MCVLATSGLYWKLHLRGFHSAEYLSLLNSPLHVFFIKQAPKPTNVPGAVKVSVYKPLETVCNSLITFSKEVTDYRYTNKCHIQRLGPRKEPLAGRREEWWSLGTRDLLLMDNYRRWKSVGLWPGGWKAECLFCRSGLGVRNQGEEMGSAQTQTTFPYHH